MADPTIPGASTGRNAIVSARGFGSRYERVLTANKGFSVVGSEDETATTRAFYPMTRTTDPAVVTFVFASAEERDNFGNWVKRYAAWLISSPSSLLHVSIPSRNYGIYGVPVSGMDFDDRVGDISTQMAVQFSSVIDAHDPMGGASAAAAGIVKMPTSQGAVGAYFYPTGTQLSGSQGIDSSLFDAQLDAQAALSGVDIGAAAAAALGLTVDANGNIVSGSVPRGAGQ